MIEHCRDLWAEPYRTDGHMTESDTDRPRSWVAHFVGADRSTVLLRKYAAPKPGEELNDYPPTVQLDEAGWLATHQDYGLDATGSPV